MSSAPLTGHEMGGSDLSRKKLNVLDMFDGVVVFSEATLPAALRQQPAESSSSSSHVPQGAADADSKPSSSPSRRSRRAAS